MEFAPVFTWYEIGLIVLGLVGIGLIVTLIIEWRNKVREKRKAEARLRRIKRGTKRADQW